MNRLRLTSLRARLTLGFAGITIAVFMAAYYFIHLAANYSPEGQAIRRLSERPSGVDGNQAPIFPPNLTIDQLQTMERRREFAVFGLMLIEFALISAGAWVVVGKTLKPLNQLARQAGFAAKDKHFYKLVAPSQDEEMVQLVTTLNDMLSNLAQISAAKGRFYSAASHELRTPLQALSGHLEVAMTRDRTAEEYRAVIHECNAQATRLVGLVQDLLLLHQLDNAVRLDRKHVPLRASIERALQLAQPLLKSRSLIVQYQPDDEIRAEAAPNQIDIFFRNVVENAAKYADPGSVVRITLSCGTKFIAFEIENQCATAGQLNKDKLFEPFYRPDRSRNAKTGGNGLGLAIVKAIAEANHFAVNLEASDKAVRLMARFPFPNQTLPPQGEEEEDWSSGTDRTAGLRTSI